MYLLIVTGLSGAGKSMALRHLEDRGFFCVDNLPSPMLSSFLALCRSVTPPIERAAVVIDSREKLFHQDAQHTLELVTSTPVDKLEILFLDCADETLLRRYNETRRVHPLAATDDTQTGIQREREYLQFLRDHANYILDTSSLRPNQFAQMLDNTLNFENSTAPALIFMSFGYKYGVPIDADLVFDMRFLTNPYYEPGLKEHSGQDADVRDFVLSCKNAVPFLDNVETILRNLLPEFVANGKPRLLVAFGCTGGRHRSVTAAEEMYRRFCVNSDGARLKLFHRDINQNVKT